MSVEVTERKPLAIDLFCGLGGWTEGLLLEGYDVIGFDIEKHEYGDQKYPGLLVIQDVLTLHGSQFKNADLIVASPPCQEYSYMAMPWSLAKQKRREYLDGTRDRKKLTALFDACFRLQKEACEAAGRHIPLVVENVKGAQEWVGRARWAFGSFFLWGDVPALMPIQKYHQRQKVKAGEQWNINRKNFTGTLGWDDGLKVPSIDGGRRTAPGKGARFTSRDCGIENGIKCGGDWFNDKQPSISRMTSSGSKARKARKAASALIAKIPLPLSRHIAATFKPKQVAA